MNYRINYNVVLFNEILYDKEIKVKNKDNELMAKCSLEDYLRRKHGDAFRQLIITKCVQSILMIDCLTEYLEECFNDSR
mgnify:CR=1 FL=1|jgi:hypothetical protein